MKKIFLGLLLTLLSQSLQARYFNTYMQGAIGRTDYSPSGYSRNPLYEPKPPKLGPGASMVMKDKEDRTRAQRKAEGEKGAGP